MKPAHASRVATVAFLVAAVTTSLSAQTVAAAALAPHVVLDTVGPDGWRMRLGPTNLGSLLASEKGRELWQRQVLPLLATVQQALGDEAVAAAARERFVGYGGRVRLAVWLRGRAERSDPPVDFAVVLDGDGRTDMKALAGDLRTLLRRSEAEWKPATLGGMEVVVGSQDGTRVTEPFAVGAGVAVVFSTGGDIDAAWRDAQAFAGELAGKAPPPSSPALRLDFDVARVLAITSADADDQARSVIKAFGLDSLARAQLSVGSAGPSVQVELAQHFAPAPRGLFAAFFPPASTVPALHRTLPTVGSGRCGHFDFAALFDTIVAVATAFGEGEAAKVRASIKEELGIDLRDDLIAHMTDEVLLTGSPLAGLDRPSEFTWTLAVALRDAKKFEAALDTMLGKAKPFLSREESVQVDGVECKRYGNMFGYDLWFAVGGGTFVFAGGRDAEEHVRRVLAALKAGPPKAEQTAMPAWLADVGRAMPPGVSGFARCDLDSLFAVPLTWWLMGVEELLPMVMDVPDDDPESRERVRELLKQHQLATLRSATGYADSVWRWRVFW